MDKKGKSIVIYFMYAIFIVVIIAAAAVVWPVYRKHRQVNDYVAELKEELKARTDEAVALNKEVHDLEHDPGAVEKVAREKFGLVRPGETILKFDNPPERDARSR